METRIVKLPKHDSVLIGRDLGEIFEPGRVYGVRKFFGEIVIIDLGESALAKEGTGNFPNEHSKIESIFTGSYVFLTTEEKETLDNEE